MGCAMPRPRTDQEFLDQKPRHDGLPSAGIVGQKEPQRLPGKHLAIDRCDLVGERFDREGTTMHGCLMIAGRFGDTQIDA